MSDWLDAHPEITTIRVAASDLNGQARGKRIAARFADKALSGGARMPLSALHIDIQGQDIADSPLVFESGDADGIIRPTERGFVTMPWLARPSALLPVWMFHDDGTPFAGDPRHALEAVLARYRARGLAPVVATELEFYLVDDSAPDLRTPLEPQSGRRRETTDTLSLQALDAFDDFFTDLYDACAAMDIPADAAISEAGRGQFEINLLHGDAMKAADDAWLFKLLVKGLARKHGCAASFMAKPWPDQSGNGLHVHFSVLDDAGRNVFDNGGAEGSAVLRHAIAGCLGAMRESTLIFAPHANSYDRLVPAAHAPTGIAWGHENRTAAIRVPGGKPAARRIEHRVAGGDINPYLMLAAVLGAALTGIEDATEPPAPITGNAYEQQLDQIPANWEEAIALFAEGPRIARIFAPELVRNLVLTKRQELRDIAPMTPEARAALYLDTV